MSIICAPPKFHAVRVIPEHVEPISIDVNVSFDAPTLQEKMTVTAQRHNCYAKREISYDADSFNQDERFELTRMLAHFVASAAGGHLE